ncbi:Cu2+-exporting ATPase [Halogranum amylolyticum]|uniref:Cu2+-exporting ATPase n=1 Tax=Halogranum amylolyticum TaxID=660520 RepID=A0A1H8U8Z3_9EURY|nr:Cu2+-exporting ATPase [Halogranum amylolyticum]
MTTCTLCDLPVRSQAVTDASVAGTFCCRGCLEIYQLVGDTEKTELSVGDLQQRLESSDDELEVPEDQETAYLSVDGMHCKTCEGFLELLATESDAVSDAQASYSTEMVQVTYDPAKTTPTNLTDIISQFGYHATLPNEEDDESEERIEFSKYRAVIAAILMMPVMAPYILFIYPVYLGIYPESFLYGSNIVSMVFGPLAVWSTLIVLGLGYPIFRGAYVSLRVGQPNMDVLIAIAVLAAYLYSLGSYLMGQRDPYFDVAVMVLVVVTIGNHLESRVKQEALGNRSALTKSRVTEARRLLEDGATEQISTSECAAGDQLLVKAGERIPVDGTVIEGSGAVDEALVTGESIPQSKSVGDNLLGGTVLTDNALIVEVGADASSTIDRLVELLWDVQSSDSGIQRIVNRFAVVFVPLVLVLAVSTTGLWLVLGNSLSTAIMAGVSVLVISCPCSLGIATPLALTSGTRDASDEGILVVNENVLEQIDETDIIVFDKTGTLTTGEMSVDDVYGERTETVLARAAAVERRSNHPIAAAIDDAAPSTTSTVTNFERNDRSVSALVDGTRVTVGHPNSFTADDWIVPSAIQQAIEAAYEDGAHPTAVGWDETVKGIITIRDTPRKEWQTVISQLSEDDRELVVLTGDDERMAQRFEAHPVIGHVFAGVRPESKEMIVRGLRERGTVTMVGDGTNDAPALASADLGIALASGTEIAVDAADAVIMDDQLTSLSTIFELAQSTRRRIKQNLIWAAGYNAIAIPLAITGYINPLIAALCMAISSLIVIFNSKRRLLKSAGS